MCHPFSSPPHVTLSAYPVCYPISPPSVHPRVPRCTVSYISVLILTQGLTIQTIQGKHLSLSAPLHVWGVYMYGVCTCTCTQHEHGATSSVYECMLYACIGSYMYVSHVTIYTVDIF